MGQNVFFLSGTANIGVSMVQIWITILREIIRNSSHICQTNGWPQLELRECYPHFHKQRH
jgi:hypothetical protein